MTDSGIFKAQEDWWHNACLFTKHDWYIYAMGYRRAVDVLTQEAMSDRGGLDYLIFPLVFCCRHYLEVTLKEITMIKEKLKKTEIPQGHNLASLWNRAKKLMDQDGRGDRAIEKTITILIQSLDIADKSSTAFRYPTGLKGDPNLQQYTHLNIRKLKEEFDCAATYLDGVRTSWKIESDLESDYED